MVFRQQANAIGPGIGPAAIPGPLTSLPPPHASLPAPPQASSNPAYLTATVSSGPQPASAYQTPPVMLPPLHFQGVDPTPGFGFQSAPGMHPSRVAALAAANGVLQSQAGVVRTADQMEDVEDDIPPAKRQKVNKVPGSQIYSEEDWIEASCELLVHFAIILIPDIICVASHFSPVSVTNGCHQSRVEARRQDCHYPRSPSQSSCFNAAGTYYPTHWQYSDRIPHTTLLRRQNAHEQKHSC